MRATVNQLKEAKARHPSTPAKVITLQQLSLHLAEVPDEEPRRYAVVRGPLRNHLMRLR